MAYRINHRKANGDTEYTRVDGDTSEVIVRRYEGTRGVIVKQGKVEVYGYNFRKGKKSKYLREREIRENLNELRNEYTHSRGFSRGRTMKHVARIPAELYWCEKANRGPQALRDPKELRRFCIDNDLMVSKP